MLPHRKGMLVGELGLKEADEQRANRDFKHEAVLFRDQPSKN